MPRERLGNVSQPYPLPKRIGSGTGTPRAGSWDNGVETSVRSKFRLIIVALRIQAPPTFLCKFKGFPGPKHFNLNDSKLVWSLIRPTEGVMTLLWYCLYHRYEIHVVHNSSLTFINPLHSFKWLSFDEAIRHVFPRGFPLFLAMPRIYICSGALVEAWRVFVPVSHHFLGRLFWTNCIVLILSTTLFTVTMKMGKDDCLYGFPNFTDFPILTFSGIV
eukprot:Gb_24199 [translate_table: standard]